MSFKTFAPETEGSYPTYELATWPLRGEESGTISVQHSAAMPFAYLRLSYQDAFNGFWLDIPAEKVPDLIRMLMQSMVVAQEGEHAEAYERLRDKE